MRKIKFRAWDGKRMIYRGLHDRNWYSEDLGGKLVEVAHPNDERLLSVMQFTGLQDKNGVDIYEGDVLKIGTDKPMVVRWSKRFASFILNREGWAFSHWFGESCNPENCEIIGNTHTTPELLNPSNN